jgi:magnesium-transporting ATPase (P-type)
VPGDIVILKAGDVIPGDCLILESKDIFLDESIHTGATFPVLPRVCCGINTSVIAIDNQY